MTTYDALTGEAAAEWRRERAQRERLTQRPELPRQQQQPAPAVRFVPAYQRELKVLNGEKLLTTKFPPRALMLTPWLPEKGLAMIFAPRGVGKTWIALSIAHAVAGGGTFLRWRATRPQRVLYIDGEMPTALLQERYGAVIRAAGINSPSENFRLLAADYQPHGLPDLADPDAQSFLNKAIGDAELIIVDNLSTVARGLKENEADSFGPVLEWLLAQRTAGRSVLLIHHAGKGGSQRGTSRKEDALDSVISLARPPGYLQSEGARFEVRFTKSRGFFGQDAEPFEARFSDGAWSISEIADDDSDGALRSLKAEGLSFRQIADRTGLSKSTVERRLKGGD